MGLMYSTKRYNVRASIKENFRYSPKEVKNLLIAIVIMGFIVSFRSWGSGEQVDSSLGLLNWLNATIIFALIMIVHTAAQKITALSYGFYGEFKVWIYGLLVALVLCFLTRGYVWILIPGGLVVFHMASHRLGYYRYGLNQSQYAISSMAGPVSTLLLAVILRLIGVLLPGNSLIQKAVIFCLVVAVTTSLPIPPLNGAILFYFSRLTYMLIFGMIIGMAAMLYFNLHFIFVLLGTIAAGGIVWFLFYWGFERKIDAK